VQITPKLSTITDISFATETVRYINKNDILNADTVRYDTDTDTVVDIFSIYWLISTANIMHDCNESKIADVTVVGRQCSRVL